MVKTFIIRCEWSKAVAPPAIALRRILKLLLRTYNARCVEARCDPESDVIPRDLLEAAVVNARAQDSSGSYFDSCFNRSRNDYHG